MEYVTDLSNIFYQKPETDILVDRDDIYLEIKYLSKITLKCKTIHNLDRNSRSGNRYIYDNEYLEELEEFVNKLTDNIKCAYSESYHDYESDKYFNIEIEDNNVLIICDDVDIKLDIENKNSLLIAMRKYYNLLKTHSEQTRKLNNMTQ